MEEGKIKVQMGEDGKVTYHDPCNLSRILDIEDEPRTAIRSTASNFQEVEESGRNTL